jgi:hypothetical protein
VIALAELDERSVRAEILTLWRTGRVKERILNAVSKGDSMLKRIDHRGVLLLSLCLCVVLWAVTFKANAVPVAEDKEVKWADLDEQPKPVTGGRADRPALLLDDQFSSEEQRLITLLRSCVPMEKRRAAIAIHRFHLHNRKLLEAVKDELLRGYRHWTRDRRYIDAMAWMCNVLGDSGNYNYAETLRQVYQCANHRKIRNYAMRNYRKIR